MADTDSYGWGTIIFVVILFIIFFILLYIASVLYPFSQSATTPPTTENINAVSTAFWVTVVLLVLIFIFMIIWLIWWAMTPTVVAEVSLPAAPVAVAQPIYEQVYERPVAQTTVYTPRMTGPVVQSNGVTPVTVTNTPRYAVSSAPPPYPPQYVRLG